MSCVSSDSEVEEIAPKPKFKPRPVRRPTPVRAGNRNSETTAQKDSGLRAQSSYLSDSDGSSSEEAYDDDFFRLRPPVNIQEPEEDTVTAMRAAEEAKAASVEPQKQAALVTLQIADADGSSDDGLTNAGNDVDDDDSDVEELTGGASDAQKNNLGKRKNSGGDGVTGSRKRRSRSVSLTPPPETQPPTLPVAAHTGAANTTASPSESNVLILDSDAEPDSELRLQCRRQRQTAHIDSLDPALQAVIQDSDHLSSHAAGTTSKGMLSARSSFQADESRPPYTQAGTTAAAAMGTPSRAQAGTDLLKIQTEFQFMYDDEFLNLEVPAMWDAKRWRRRTKVIQKLNERIAVVVFSSDTMGKALQAFSDNFAVDVIATDPVLMSNSIRVFPTSLVSSLGNKPVLYIKVYPRSVHLRLREKEALERARHAMEYEQAQRELQLTRELQRATGADALDLDQDIDVPESLGGVGGGGSVLNTNQDGAGAAAVRIKIRDRSGRDTLLLVVATTTIQSIINNYREMAGIPESTKVTLEFDDEKLDPGDTVGDTEIEDDDMLTAHSR
ncbi:hypothetical protein GQ54DRAFT_329774 [Martensiomyces pterosporus]|nr:hypothetical protein GQ54DRAFT_329774 [Martensiomyces pterosporus]